MKNKILGSILLTAAVAFSLTGCGSNVDTASATNTAAAQATETDEKRDVADRIAFMDQGKILDISPAKEFFAHTANERVKQFLASYLAQFSYVV